jgi:hypothetical protein
MVWSEILAGLDRLVDEWLRAEDVEPVRRLVLRLQESGFHVRSVEIQNRLTQLEDDLLLRRLLNVTEDLDFHGIREWIHAAQQVLDKEPDRVSHVLAAIRTVGRAVELYADGLVGYYENSYDKRRSQLLDFPFLLSDSTDELSKPFSPPPWIRESLRPVQKSISNAVASQDVVSIGQALVSMAECNDTFEEQFNFPSKLPF